MKARIPKNENNEAGILQEKGSLFISLYSFMFIMAHWGTQVQMYRDLSDTANFCKVGGTKVHKQKSVFLPILYIF